MIEAVFISDLHLHPEEKDIQERFDQFVKWAGCAVKTIYILGDFFHVWAGDDGINAWSRGIAEQLRVLTEQGIKIFYMHGNRDFLLGSTFSRLAGWTVLPEPTVIRCGQEKILLAHGDRYCTKDKAHQRFRLLTRNRIFSMFFLSLSLRKRERLVSQVRERSQSGQRKSVEQMDVVPSAVIAHMIKYRVTQLIHGHTHKPGITHYSDNGIHYTRYVLSDWDDSPKLLCYHDTKGLCFIHDLMLEASNG